MGSTHERSAHKRARYAGSSFVAAAIILLGPLAGCGAGGATVGQTQISCTPSVVVADGQSSATVTVTVRDATGSVTPQAAVRLTASDISSTFATSSGVTNAAGQFQTAVTSSQVDVDTVTATLDSGAVVSCSVQFVAGTPSQVHSTLVVAPTPQVADGNQAVVATLTLRDAFGRAVMGALPSFVTSGTAIVATSASATDAAGRASVALRSSLAQQANVSVSQGDVSLTAPMAFVAGQPDAAHAQIVATPTQGIAADGSTAATCTVTLADAFGNPASQQNVIWSTSDANAALAAPQTRTDAQGQSSTTLTAVLPGSVVVWARSGNAAPMATVTFTAAAAAATPPLDSSVASAGSFVAVPTQLAADGATKTTLTLMARDANGMPAAMAPVTLVDAVPGHALSPASGTTDANGLFVTALTSAQAGNHTVTARYTGGQQTVTVSFLPLQSDCAFTSFFGGPPWPTTGAASPIAPVAVADFNGDDIDDLAVLNVNGTVQVALGRGSRLFAPPLAWAAGGLSTCLALGDLNGDGHLDLITCQTTQNTISVAFGRADGAFATPTSYAVGQMPRAVAVADINDDGFADLAVTNYGDGTVTILFNDGSGTTFSPQVTVSAGSAPYGIVAGPVVSTTAIDLVISDEQGAQIVILPNAGNETFNAPISFAVGTLPRAVALADVDGDQLLDVAVASAGQKSIDIMVNKGSGHLASPVTLELAEAPASVALACLGAVGSLPDVVVAGVAGDSAYVFKNAGDGTFGTSSRYAIANGSIALAAADVDGDGLIDLVGAHQNALGIASISYNDGAYTFGTSAAYTAVAPRAALAVDFDNDGNADVFAVNGSGTSSLYWGQSTGVFAPPLAMPVGGAPVAAVAGDLNADGLIDVVVANNVDHTLSLLVNEGNRIFAAQTTYPTGTAPVALALGDLDGNGSLDVAVANSGGNSVSFLFNDGHGRLTPGATPFAVGGMPQGLALADFDADGLLDLAVARYDLDDVVLAKNLGGGQFAERGHYAVGQGPIAIVANDFDGDGSVDCAVLNQTSSTLSMLFNRQASLTPGPELTVGDASSTIAMADLNGDALMDLIVPSHAANAVVLLYNLGGGDFAAPLTYAVDGYGPTSAVAADFNLDGHLDLAVTTHDDPAMRTLLWNACY